MSEYYDMQNDDSSVVSYDISIIPNDFNVLTINSLIESNIISMPAFQRNYVWDKKRASRFIESLILGLPVPQIFLYQLERNRYSIIDGQQRLLTIYFFIKQRFPKSGKRAFLRKEFEKEGKFTEEILNDNQFFQDFKLQFTKLETGENHPLNNQMYNTLDADKKNSLDLMPIRCMAIRQNKPEDNGAMYEIFNRLNTGGINLSPQEIRGCIYESKFYKLIYKLNTTNEWRKLIGKVEEDDKFRDVEILLRSFAFYYDSGDYSGSMIKFLNNFSRNAMLFKDKEIKMFENVFYKFIEACSDINPKSFLNNNGSFNVSLFDSVFTVVSKKIDSNIEKIKITQSAFDRLRRDSQFKEAITHSTSHVDSVKSRLDLAEKYLFETK